MTRADTALDGGTATEGRRRISTPASTIGPWLPEGALGEALAEGLTRVEDVLGTAVGSEHPFVREAAGHLVSAGGKRFRPMLDAGAEIRGRTPDISPPSTTSRATVINRRI